MTQIDAINKMMRYVGEIPIPLSVVIDDLPDGHEAKEARTILGEQSRELQARGWWFNTEDWTFVVSEGSVTVSEDVISVQSTSRTQEYLIKGGDLYDVNNSTKMFTENVELVTIFETPLEDLPDTFLNYLLYVSAKELHLYLNGDDITQKELDKKVGNSWLALDKESLKRKRSNLMRNSRLLDRTSNPTALA